MQIKIVKSILLIITLAILAGCSLEHKSEDLSYSFTENDCPTGKVTYSDHADKCAAFKDDARNNYCARATRYREFQEQCAGQSWQN